MDDDDDADDKVARAHTSCYLRCCCDVNMIGRLINAHLCRWWRRSRYQKAFDLTGRVVDFERLRRISLRLGRRSTAKDLGRDQVMPILNLLLFVENNLIMIPKITVYVLSRDIQMAVRRGVCTGPRRY